MTKEQYTTIKGKKLYRPVLSVKEMQKIQFDGMGGFCLACGEETREVEPDAEKYTCEYCDDKMLFGVEQLLIMGIARIK